MQPSRIFVDDIKKSFGTKKNEQIVLQNVTCSFEQGQSYALTGVSGTGKSTLMHLLVGLDTPTAGTVFFNDRDMYLMSTQEHTHFLRKSVGLMFQLPYLIRELSVLENVMLPGLIVGTPQEECEKKANELLNQVGILEKADQKPGSLSGGQQQRAALARALCNEPAFLCADEPTGNLDERTGKQMVDLLVRLQTEWGMGLIISTHDTYVAQQMQHCYRLHNGTLDTV